MARSTHNPWLNRFAVLTAFVTLCLIGIGGLVTSHGAGMAVPDWPTTYGYNMFLFPISKWVGGIFYEHTHRLVASGVGFLTMILMAWLLAKEARAWLRWLGVVALFAVILQGVLGGLRVTLYKDQIGIFHATLAQLFLVLVSAIAVFTSQWWQRLKANPGVPAHLRHAFQSLSVMILMQLMMGATMRHQHAGLAVPDFPLAYGKIWPSTEAATLQAINQQRVDTRDFKPITAFQIYLHMAHRIWAELILAAAAACVWAVRRSKVGGALATAVWALFGLILLQATLGALTVWSNKAADIATLHVIFGAVSLVFASLITLALYKLTAVAVNEPQTTTNREADKMAAKPLSITAT